MTREIDRILLLNVGRPTNGSVMDRPEVFSLREAKPDYVVFVCSQPSESQAGSLDFVAEYAKLAGLSEKNRTKL